MAGWIINPTVDMVSVLAEYGRFLENDYRMVIEHLEIPKQFEEYSEKTGRKFVIYGGKEAPGVIAKSVFLCLKLSGAISLSVKTVNLDESYLVQNVLDHYSGDIKTKQFVAHSDELRLDEEWRNEVMEATDIVVFGDQKVMEAFRDYETVDRHVWEHGQKFSFGVVREEYLSDSIIKQICFDFFSFYGEGAKAPKFYFLVGRLKKSTAHKFNNMMTAFYGPLINEYRSKLPLTRRSSLTNDLVNSNYITKYVRLDDLNSDEIFGTLYGDIRLVVVDDLTDVEDFIEKWCDSISTVAMDINDYDVLDMLEQQQVMRICNIGDMQFPDFFEQYDPVDDFNIYVKDDEDYDIF